VGTYAERLVRSLLSIDPDNTYTLFLVEPNPQIEAANLRKVLIPGYERMFRNRWWENVLLPRYLRREKIDLFFSPGFVLPVESVTSLLFDRLPLSSAVNPRAGSKRTARYVATVHDVASAVVPETFTPKMRMWQHLFCKNVVAAADRIIVDSESTSRDFLKFYGGDPRRISVVSLSVDESFAPVKDANVLESVRRRYSLPASFILCVGTIEPRKNVVTLATAYSRLSEETREAFPLVFVGGRGWYSESIISSIEDLGLGKSVKYVGFAAHADLPALYSLATIFVYPSLYEGFGYPPLEAMACGTPVISSNKSSLPEVVGDAGIMVDPLDIEALSANMRRLLDTPSLRSELRGRGLIRAQLFNWRKTAEKTLEIFRGSFGL